MSHVRTTVRVFSYWPKDSIPESFRRREWGRPRGKIHTASVWRMSRRNTELPCNYLHKSPASLNSSATIFQSTTLLPQTCTRVIGMRLHPLVPTTTTTTTLCYHVTRLKPIAFTGAITMFIAHQPTESREFAAGSRKQEAIGPATRR